MRFLVTGGAGFIGSAFIRNLLLNKLISRPSEVVALDSLTYAGNRRNLSSVWEDERLTFVHGDIRDRNLVDSLVKESDVVFNFAAESHVDRSIEDSGSFITTNIIGTAVLAQSCIDNGYKRLIQISTDEVYGSIESGSWTEDSLLEPNSPYAASKAAAEMLLRGLGKTHGLDYRITRCANNYGPYQFPEKLIPNFIWRLLNDLDLPIYGTGENIREWIHVDDHCRAIELVAFNGKPQEIYNIGGETAINNKSLALNLVELFQETKSQLIFVQDRKNHDFRYSLHDSKIRQELAYTPQKKFFQEIAGVVDWYKKNSDWFFDSFKSKENCK